MNGDVVEVDLMHRTEVLPVDGHLLEVVQRVEAVDDSNMIERRRVKITKQIKTKQKVDLLPKDGVLEVKVRLLGIGNVKLAGVCVWAVVGHGDYASVGVSKLLADLILKLAAPGGLAALARIRRIARLHHEALDVPVKLATVVVVAGGQGEEVLVRKKNPED